MTRTRSLLFALAVAALLIGAVMAQTGSPAASGQATNFWTLTVGEDSPKRADEAVVDLHNPRTVAVCGKRLLGNIDLSIDGKHWYGLDMQSDCVQAPAVRFVKLRQNGDRNNAEVYATY
jgi:hypothetical protein